MIVEIRCSFALSILICIEHKKNERERKKKKKTFITSGPGLYFQELESLFSEHFGRTPTASQASDFAEECEAVIDEEEEEPGQTSVTDDVNARARRFLENNQSSDNDTDDDASASVASNDPDLEKIHALKSSGCGCRRHCMSRFSEADIYSHVLSIREMQRSEKEMYTMSSFTDSIDKGATKWGKKRQRQSHEFTFRGNRVCKRIFMLLFDIGKQSLQSLMKHVGENGVIPRIHGNTNRQLSKSLQFCGHTAGCAICDKLCRWVQYSTTCGTTWSWQYCTCVSF